MTAISKMSPAVRHNLTLLLDALRYHEIKRMRVSFRGSGDSGDIYVTKIESIDDDVKLDDEYLRSSYVTGAHMSEMWEGGNKRDWTKKPPTIYDLAYEVCWAELEASCGGWEIDNGSSGEFIFEPLAPLQKRDQVIFHFSHNERDYDYSDYEGEEYNDE